MWGKAEAETHDGLPVLIEFRTASRIRSRSDVRGVRIKNAEEPTEQFPLVDKPSAKAKRWLRVVDRVRKQLKDEAYQERMRVKAMREQRH